jgi:hypothetical protein
VFGGKRVPGFSPHDHRILALIASAISARMQSVFKGLRPLDPIRACG